MLKEMTHLGNEMKRPTLENKTKRCTLEMKRNDAPSFDIIKGMTYLEEDMKGGEEAGEKKREQRSG